jgi:hypothetical protein
LGKQPGNLVCGWDQALQIRPYVSRPRPVAARLSCLRAQSRCEPLGGITPMHISSGVTVCESSVGKQPSNPLDLSAAWTKLFRSGHCLVCLGPRPMAKQPRPLPQHHKWNESRRSTCFIVFVIFQMVPLVMDMIIRHRIPTLIPPRRWTELLRAQSHCKPLGGITPMHISSGVTVTLFVKVLWENNQATP